MKDPYRKFRQCIFCENAPDNKEHIISKWIGRVLKPGANASGLKRKINPDGTAQIIDVKASSPITGFTSKSVCTECNTGWMHRVVDEAKPLLEKLISGTYHGVISRDDQLRLYRHFAITGMVVDVETVHSEQALHQFLRANFKLEQAPLEQIQVSIAKYHKHLKNPHFNIAHGVLITDIKAIQCKTVSMVIGSLAVAIDVGAESKAKPFGYVRLNEMESLKWPHIKVIKDRHVRRLANYDQHGNLMLPTVP